MLIWSHFKIFVTYMNERVKLAEKRFPGSRPAREKPFRIYRDTREITVKLTDLAEGWNSNKRDDTQVNCNLNKMF